MMTSRCECSVAVMNIPCSCDENSILLACSVVVEESLFGKMVIIVVIMWL